MELALAIMMVLGIFVAIPAAIGFVIVGVFVLNTRRIRKAECAKAVEKAEEILKEPVEEKEQVLVV